MVNAEILQAFLWHISLYSHSLEDIDTEADLITQARHFIGIDLGLLREGICFDDVLLLLLLDIERQINKCDWSGAERNCQLFDRLAQNQKVSITLLFERWYHEAEVLRRQGFYDKALLCAYQAEAFADNPLHKFRTLLLRGDIESANNNRYEFGINSLSLALYEAEQLGQQYVAQVYNKMAHMCSMRYAGLGIYFLRKAQVIGDKLGDAQLILDNKFARANSYIVLAVRHPNEEQLFLDEAKRVLNSIQYDKLPLPQNKIYYKEMWARVNHDVEPLKDAYVFYAKINALDDVCRICDAIIEIGINYHQPAQALPYIAIYREALIKRNRKDVQANLGYLQQTEEIINGILGRETK